MKLSILNILFLSLLSFVSYGQKRYLVDRFDSSFFHVKQLKTAEVLIRLKTNENSIYYMKAKGNNVAAEELRKKQLVKNREIVDAFKQMYDFSDVKFFYSTHTLNVKNGYYDGIFLNDSLVSDESIKLRDTSNVYIIDVGHVYFPSFGNHMEGIVMMDNSFKPLPKPFPYFVRKRSGLFFLKRTYAEVVELFNRQIHDFYDYTIGGGEYETMAKRKRKRELYGKDKKKNEKKEKEATTDSKSSN